MVLSQQKGMTLYDQLSQAVWGIFARVFPKVLQFPCGFHTNSGISLSLNVHPV